MNKKTEHQTVTLKQIKTILYQCHEGLMKACKSHHELYQMKQREEAEKLAMEEKTHK